MGRTLLLIGDAVAARPALRVARCQGWQADCVPDLASAAQRSADVIAVQWQGETRAEALAPLAQAAQIIVLSDAAHTPPMEALLEQPWFAHLLGLHSPWFMPDLGATLAKIGGRSPLGIEPWLPWGARINAYAIASSAEKPKLFEHIERFMADIGMRGRLVRRLTAVADELLMNAIYDAPLDRATGQPKYAERRRSEAVELAPDERPTFYLGSDGERVVIGVRDPFGALKPHTLKSYIHKGLRRGADQIDRKQGGAGLGLYLLFDALNSLCVNLTPGQATEVIGAMNIRGSMRDVLATPKAFSVHVHDPKARP